MKTREERMEVLKQIGTGSYPLIGALSRSVSIRKVDQIQENAK
jgi:hypothetical protein